jgi:sulfite dehydrogenase (quinone) subunit SoeC
MHPALSIIAFTTLSGLGYGLAAVLGLGLLDPAALAGKAAYLIALALIGGGLLASTLHLGNPQRAWRALSQWRTSWLSREGVMALATFLPLAWLTVTALFFHRHQPLAGMLTVLGAALTVVSTGMIYASLKAIDAWHTPLTPACYLALSLQGGALLGTFFAVLGSGGGGQAPAWLALAATAAAWLLKAAWLARLDRLTPTSSPESATGLGGIGRVRLFEPPHTNPNYLTREMGFRVARKHAAKLRRLAFGFGAVVPALAVAAALAAGFKAPAAGLLAVAVLAQLLGTVIERWLFFAEARHAMVNFYGG